MNSSSEVPSFLAKPPALDFSVVVVSRDDLPAVQRCAASVLRYAPPATELIVVDNGSPLDVAAAVEAFARSHDSVRVVLTDHNVGAAAARNIGARLAVGSIVVFVDTSVEFTGDALTALLPALAANDAGIVGRWGVNTNDLREFTDAHGPDVDAIEGYLMALKRERLAEIGLFDEKYRFYRHLDLDASFAVRMRGYRNRIVAELPMIRHEHTEWNRLPPEERDRLSKRNYYRFLHKYRDAEHLLLAHAAR